MYVRFSRKKLLPEFQEFQSASHVMLAREHGVEMSTAAMLGWTSLDVRSVLMAILET